jgi:hypothetical protein
MERSFRQLLQQRNATLLFMYYIRIPTSLCYPAVESAWWQNTDNNLNFPWSGYSHVKKITLWLCLMQGEVSTQQSFGCRLLMESNIRMFQEFSKILQLALTTMLPGT